MGFWFFKLRFSLVSLEIVEEGIIELRINIYGLINLVNRVFNRDWKRFIGWFSEFYLVI